MNKILYFYTQYCIRIFRPDGTFGTLIAPLNTTTNDLIQRLAGKFFLQDLSKYRLTLARSNLGKAIFSPSFFLWN